MNARIADPQPGAGAPTRTRIVAVGLLVGFLLNFTGWLGNNLLLGGLWDSVAADANPTEWATALWSDAFSLAPDFVYGIAMVWLYVVCRAASASRISAALQSGLFVSLVGGIVTYFAIANSGFIPWRLALASFVLVLATKIPLAFLGGYLVEPRLDGTASAGNGSGDL